MSISKLKDKAKFDEFISSNIELVNLAFSTMGFSAKDRNKKLLAQNAKDFFNYSKKTTLDQIYYTIKWKHSGRPKKTKYVE